MERLIRNPAYPYSIRRSQRAKYAQIKIAPNGAITVVIPQRFSLKHIPEILGTHKDWIDKQLSSIKSSYNPETDSDKPQKIILTAIEEQWQVDYMSTPSKSLQSAPRRLKAQSKIRRLCISTTDSMEVKRQLSTWLNHKARAMLTSHVQTLCDETRLSCSGISIRNQRTRWGSCSVKKHLSLNRNLIFLPARSVRYLILHELCHTVHMNHSRRFWQLVECFEPEYKQLDKSLTVAKRLIPYWAMPGE